MLAHCNGEFYSSFSRTAELIEWLWNQRKGATLTLPGGLSTSPAIIIGYLMWKYGLSYENTLNYVQSKRYCVSPTSVSLLETMIAVTAT